MKIKFLKIIKRHRILRIALMLIFLFLIILFVLLYFNGSFKDKIESNQQEIDIATQKLANLQALVDAENIDSSQVLDKQLAPYDTIVPFIGLLENIFEIIDPESTILIKDEEAQIFLNRYADYEARISINDQKTLFFEALDAIHNGIYLTEITQMNLVYSLQEDGETYALETANLAIRLFFE